MSHQIIPMYQLEKPVGKNSPNLSDDVKLVEALIEACARLLTADNIKNFAARASVPPPAKLSITGRYNDNLQAWIDICQAIMNSSGLSRAKDGVVDPLPISKHNRNDVVTNFGKNMYLLWSLQVTVLKLRGAEEFLSLRSKLGLQYEAYAGGAEPLRF